MTTTYASYAELKTCGECLREFNHADERTAILDGWYLCEECILPCAGDCGEFLTDKSIALWGPVIRYRDYLRDGKLVSAHADCAAQTLLGYMSLREEIEDVTREEIASLVAPHFAAALVRQVYPEAMCFACDGWFYVIKSPIHCNLDKSGILDCGRTEAEAWIDAAKGVALAQSA